MMITRCSMKTKKRFLFLLFVLLLPSLVIAQGKTDWVTGFPRKSIHIKEWPGKRKVAVCFVFYVEVWGFGQGPNFRPDMTTRNPDLVNGAFRQYGINRGITRVAKLFKEQGVPLSIALNALFPVQRPEIWNKLRKIQPHAPIIAHGMNNSSEQLPLGRGINAQEKYINKTLNLIEKTTGERPKGWSSPSVYANGDTFTATVAEGIKYSLDAMDTDVLSDLVTPKGSLVLLPYPVVTVDMGQNLARNKTPEEISTLWLDYVAELVREAKSDPSSEATVVAIGIHPFVIGRPDGAFVMRSVLEKLKKEKLVWLTDVEAVIKATGQK